MASGTQMWTVACLHGLRNVHPEQSQQVGSSLSGRGANTRAEAATQKVRAGKHPLKTVGHKRYQLRLLQNFGSVS
eukprot:603666-Amphidinium_carterae.1